MAVFRTEDPFVRYTLFCLPRYQKWNLRQQLQNGS